MAAGQDSGQVVIAVKVRPGANDAVADAAVAGAARAHGGIRRQTLHQLDTVSVEVPKAAVAAFTAQMLGRHDVANVAPAVRRWPSQIPNDPRYPNQASYLDAIAAPTAWDVHTGASAVRIAVVDSGMDVNHPDLIGRIAGTYNAVTGSTDVTDTMGHGTFVGGVAAATANNSIGIAGASLGASLLAVKVADADGLIWSDAVGAGIIWAADHGATVINLSLGSTSSDSVEQSAVAYAVAHGVLVVASAGNEANSTPNYPAAYPQVVAVGATNVATGGRASFSSFGSWVTVAAPGVNITGTAPTSGSTFFGPSYAIANGTSFSSPIVAAEAALLSSLRPTASAADLRQAIVGTAHGYPDQGLGTGQVDFRAAYDALSPAFATALTQPAAGVTVTGVVDLSATSAAPKVGFTINDRLMSTPVATSAGTATASWTSWGAANGPLNVAALDCGVDNVCDAAPPAEVSLTLANAAPAITSPTESQTLTGSATFTATAPGGGVAFLVDGVSRGFDATEPYALTYPISLLSDATHTVQARSCSATGIECAGPLSRPVTFTSESLHPRISAVTPALFSPNGDRRYDTTTLTYYLPDTESARFQVRNAAGTIVRGSTVMGTLSSGTRSVIWNGLLNGGARAANGRYTLEISTSSGTLRGSATAQVVVDTTAPTMTSITGSGARFYPYPDGFRDTFTPWFTLNDRAKVTMTVRTVGGTLVRSISGSRVAGRTSIAWNGKNTAGSRVAAGTYYWTLTAQDAAGNRRISSRYSVIVNLTRY